MLTAACFAVLFVSPDCGERLGYGITIILAMEVYKVFGACRQRRVIQLGDHSHPRRIQLGMTI